MACVLTFPPWDSMQDKTLELLKPWITEKLFSARPCWKVAPRPVCKNLGNFEFCEMRPETSPSLDSYCHHGKNGKRTWFFRSFLLPALPFVPSQILVKKIHINEAYNVFPFRWIFANACLVHSIDNHSPTHQVLISAGIAYAKKTTCWSTANPSIFIELCFYTYLLVLQ